MSLPRTCRGHRGNVDGTCLWTAASCCTLLLGCVTVSTNWSRHGLLCTRSEAISYESCELTKRTIACKILNWNHMIENNPWNHWLCFCSKKSIVYCIWLYSYSSSPLLYRDSYQRATYPLHTFPAAVCSAWYLCLPRSTQVDLRLSPNPRKAGGVSQSQALGINVTLVSEGKIWSLIVPGKFFHPQCRIAHSLTRPYTRPPFDWMWGQEQSL